MTLQQLKYCLKISELGSMHQAAEELLVTQPNLSKAIKELEDEMGITIFIRNSRGVSLTEEGIKFVTYAKQVIEQSDLLEERYKGDKKIKRIFAISAQHYAFVVKAFVELVRELGKDTYEFSLRECKTKEIIEDVKNARSELGVIYLSNFNKEIIKKTILDSNLKYESLFKAKPHVFLSKNHPLAKKGTVTLKDLEDYPKFTYDQGENNSFFFSEELHSTDLSKKSIVVSDRATLFNLLRGLDGYTISSGIISKELNDDNIISVPLKSSEVMEIVYIYNPDRSYKQITKRYIEILKEYVERLEGDIITS